MPTDRPMSYRIFLLTFWLEDECELADPEAWRFRLEEPKSGTHLGCVGLAALVAHLKQDLVDDAISIEGQPK